MFPIFFATLNAEDRLTVEALYLEYEKALYRCAYKIVADPKYAEDAVNDAFLALINTFDDLSEKTEEMAAFLFTACKNSAWKYNSTKNGGKELLVPDADLFPPTEDSELEEALILNKYTPEELNCALAEEYEKLSETEKELLKLRLFCRLDYKKISKLTEKSTPALRNAYSRLIKKLKRRLGA